MTMQAFGKSIYFGIILLFPIFQSCKTTLYDFKNYSTSSAKGSISGQEWNYAYAYTDPEAKLPEGQEFMIVLVTGATKTACPDRSDQLPDAREVVISIDGKLGEMKIGARSSRLETEDDAFRYVKTERQASLAFFDPSLPEKDQYRFAKSGKVKITTLTKDTVEGSVLAKISKSFFVNGRFKAKVCKYGQLN